MVSFSQAVISTLAYSSVFDAPLSVSTLYERMIASDTSSGSFSQFKEKITRLPEVVCKDDMVFLKGDDHLLEVRKARREWSAQKGVEVTRIVHILKKIPTITAVYITGALAVENVSSVHDDIDVLVVTKSQTLWFTRILVILMTSVIGKYRLHDTDGQNSWCFNLWLDQDHLQLPQKDRSLYTAYEVVQAKLVVGDSNILLDENRWVKEYLPNITLPKESQLKPTTQRVSIAFLNKGAYYIQSRYMKKRKTREKVALGYAFFHPRDTQEVVMKKWQEKKAHYSP